MARTLFLTTTLVSCHRDGGKQGNTQTATPVGSGSSGAVSVQIVSGWVGLGKPARADLQLTRTAAGDFEGSWSHAETAMFGNAPWKQAAAQPRRVASGDVDHLASALRHSCMPSPSLAPYGITAATLRAHVWAGEESLKPYFDYKAVPAGASSIFVHEFTDVAKAQAALEHVYGSRHTDDYPSADITIKMADGTKLIASSMSQSEEMLPWDVAHQGTVPCTTYDPAISHALGKLMPEAMLNQNRLSDTFLYSTLADEIVAEMDAAGEVRKEHR